MQQSSPQGQVHKSAYSHTIIDEVAVSRIVTGTDAIGRERVMASPALFCVQIAKPRHIAFQIQGAFYANLVG